MSNIFGEHAENTLVQFADVSSRAAASALMADGHYGYVMPVGGVAAYRGLASVVGVGFDIACGNCAIQTDMNIADFGKSQVISGLRSEFCVDFYIDLANQFRGSWKGGADLGNEGHAGSTLEDVVRKVLERHPKAHPKTTAEWVDALTPAGDEEPEVEAAEDEDEDDDVESFGDCHVHDLLVERLLGQAEQYDDANFCRVVEDFKVYFIPHAIMEVTNQFQFPKVKK